MVFTNIPRNAIRAWFDWFSLRPRCHSEEQNNPEESMKRLEQAAGIFRKLAAKLDLQKTEAKLSSQSRRLNIS
jgi:hypothetical protein